MASGKNALSEPGSEKWKKSRCSAETEINDALSKKKKLKPVFARIKFAGAVYFAIALQKSEVRLPKE